MRTPRPQAVTRRGIATLIGNGWLKESPKNLWPRGWDIKSRSALKKCVFLPIPPDAKAFLDALPPPKPAPAIKEPTVATAKRPSTPPLRPHNAMREPRMFAALSPEDVESHQRRKLFVEAQRAAAAAASGKTAMQPRAWYEDPIALGTLLIMVPPIGLAALWSSKRYSSDARWALTVMTGLTLCLAAAVVVALSALSR